MSNVSFSQLILLLLIVFLLFGDTSKLINKINLFIKKTNHKKNRKKGT
jgi:Sec-independent protein translocase protein TatA